MKVAVTKDLARQVKAAIRKKRGFLTVTMWFYGKDNKIRIEESDDDEEWD